LTCSLLHSIGAHHHPFVVLFSCYVGVFYWCLLLLIVFHYSLAFLSMFCYCLSCFVGGHCCPCVTFYWWSSMPPIALVSVRCCLHVTICWCSLLSSNYVLLVFMDTLCYTSLMFVMASLLHFIGVCCHPLATLCWCLLMAFCCALIDVCRDPFDVFY